MAIVIDPVRTISAGKVCLGAFRTYPKVIRFIFLIKFIYFLLTIDLELFYKKYIAGE